jgi:predicted ABC-type transport system involved in lysophospholipase L1 biosynthesis ATPase subunit
MTMLEARDLHKSYTIEKQAVNVLKGATLSVETGESVAIVGVSGAGKSTLLHILGGLDRPDEGAVMLGGRDLYESSSRSRAQIRGREIGFVFQSYHLLPELDVAENVMLPAMNRLCFDGDPDLRRRHALELLETVGLADRAHHTPLELSGGEQQRVAVARALMNDPRMILADEPTGNLDSGTGRQIIDALFALSRNQDRTLLIVTHNESLAGECDRALRIEGGAIR